MTWTEEDHQHFYDHLKGLDTTTRSQHLLDKAGELIEAAPPGEGEWLKAAESLLTFWTLHIRLESHHSLANHLFRNLYLKLGDPDKADSFLT